MLPQLAPLQARLAQARFLHDVRAHREDCAALTPDALARLLRAAAALLPHHAVERERAQLYKLQGTPDMLGGFGIYYTAFFMKIPKHAVEIGETAKMI